jgi:hypothetical protein
MKHALSVSVLAVLVVCTALAARAATKPEERLAEIRLWVDMGRYDEAAAAARLLARSDRDDQTKTEATRLLALALRKKGDWRTAAQTYKDLAARYEKDSDASILAEATADVLLASSNGVYPGLEKPAPAGGDPASAVADKSAAAKPAQEPPPKPAAKTLADDDTLKAALVKEAEKRVAGLKGRIAEMKRAKTPEEVAAAFVQIAEVFRCARVLAPDRDYEAEQEAAKAAGDRMDALWSDARPWLRDRLTEMQRDAASRGSVSSAEKKELEGYQQMATRMADAEGVFRSGLEKVGGPAWAERRALVLKSVEREREYGLLARGFQMLLTRPYGGLIPRRRLN